MMKTVGFQNKFAKSAVRGPCRSHARSLQQFSLRFQIVAVRITLMGQNIDAHVHLVQNDAWLTGCMVRKRVAIEVDTIPPCILVYSPIVLTFNLKLDVPFEDAANASMQPLHAASQ